MILADQIRQYAFSTYIQPVQAVNPSHTMPVTIVSRDVVKGMMLNDRTPAVCQALDAQKFQTDNNLTLMARTGPKQGRTATWLFLV
jgi:hypothetical protein